MKYLDVGDDESAQDFTELLKINHNFIKSHQGLDGKTPSESAGINLNFWGSKNVTRMLQNLWMH